MTRSVSVTSWRARPIWRLRCHPIRSGASAGASARIVAGTLSESSARRAARPSVTSAS